MTIQLKQFTKPSGNTQGSTIVFDNEGKWSNASTYGLLLPTGSTSQRPENPPEGLIRFNNETHELEVFGSGWTNIVRERKYSFQANFNNSHLQSITTAPETSGWTFTINANTVTITHNLGRLPYRFIIHGQDGADPTKFRIVVYKGNNPDDLDIYYHTGDLNVFVMENLNSGTTASGSNAMCRVDVYF